MFKLKYPLLLPILLLLLLTTGQSYADKNEWTTFIKAEQLSDLLKQGALLLDARSAEEYKLGHIPGAINLPGSSLRTPKAKPGSGLSQYIFRRADGSPDVSRYEDILGKAGITRDTPVIVYGNHGGKADGTVAAFILSWLGSEKVYFLDGIGVSSYTRGGGSLSTEERVLKSATFEAREGKDAIWNLDEVIRNIKNENVVFWDTRSKAEFDGLETRGNRRPGHIPGALLLNYSDLLDANKEIKSKAEVSALLKARGITKDKTILLYCQTATRTSLPALALKELGYTNVHTYDGSWHEYGNRDDTPIVSAADTTPGNDEAPSVAVNTYK